LKSRRIVVNIAEKPDKDNKFSQAVSTFGWAAVILVLGLGLDVTGLVNT
jgi:hypothetical protein